jgi:hypothetical protein
MKLHFSSILLHSTRSLGTINPHHDEKYHTEVLSSLPHFSVPTIFSRLSRTFPHSSNHNLTPLSLSIQCLILNHSSLSPEPTPRTPKITTRDRAKHHLFQRRPKKQSGRRASQHLQKFAASPGDVKAQLILSLLAMARLMAKLIHPIATAMEVKEPTEEER